MTRYLLQLRDRILVKVYGFLSFAKNMGKYISKNVSGKYGQKLCDHGEKSVPDALKTSSKRDIQKTAEATSDLIGNKIANKITKLSKNWETDTNTHDKEIHKERYIFPEERQKIIDELRLK